MLLYNCLIIEDEPLAVEIMETYISQVSFLKVKKVCSDAIDALEVLRKEKIDLIFLDIHLPKLKGFDFLKALNNPPKVIITSAYHQYALSGYEFNVIDYLLKPIEFSRFLMAVNKLRPVEDKLSQSSPSTGVPYLFFNVNRKKIRVNLEDILYIEGQKEYVKIYTDTGAITTKISLGAIHEMLPEESFLRVHRSFIVSISRIEAYSLNAVEIGKKQIPIGRSYKELVQASLSRLF